MTKDKDYKSALPTELQMKIVTLGMMTWTNKQVIYINLLNPENVLSWKMNDE